MPALPPSRRPIPRRFSKDERSNSIIVLVSFTSVSYYLQFCFVWVTPSPVFFPPCYPRELRADCSQCSVTGCHPTEPAAASCPKTPLSFPREAILSPFPLLSFLSFPSLSSALNSLSHVWRGCSVPPQRCPTSQQAFRTHSVHKAADQTCPGGFMCQLGFWNTPQLPENSEGGDGNAFVILKSRVPSASGLWRGSTQ